MCWIGKNCPIVADKDISVFKIGVQKKSSKKIYSYFQFMIYELGITYRSDIVKYDGLHDPDCITILEGLHSYSMDVAVIQDKNKYDGSSYIKVVIKRNGNEKLLRYCLNNVEEYKLVVMDCIIPKDATYYINEDGEVVSNLIKFVKINSI